MKSNTVRAARRTDDRFAHFAYCLCGRFPRTAALSDWRPDRPVPAHRSTKNIVGLNRNIIHPGYVIASEVYDAQNQ